jgi:hypothetical protein
MSVVRGTAGVPVQACQGSYAPPSTPVAGTANWATVRPCPVHPARIAFFEQQAQPKVHRTARGVASRPRQENGAFRDSLNSCAIFRRACGAIFHNLLKQQKIAPGLDATAPSGRMNRACCENAAA